MKKKAKQAASSEKREPNTELREKEARELRDFDPASVLRAFTEGKEDVKIDRYQPLRTKKYESSFVPDHAQED